MSDIFTITNAQYAVLRTLEDIVSGRKGSLGTAHVNINIRTGAGSITLSTWSNLFGYKTEYAVEFEKPAGFDAALDKLVNAIVPGND